MRAHLIGLALVLSACGVQAGQSASPGNELPAPESAPEPAPDRAEMDAAEANLDPDATTAPTEPAPESAPEPAPLPLDDDALRACRVERVTVETAVEAYVAQHLEQPVSMADLVPDLLLTEPSWFELEFPPNEPVRVVASPGGRCDVDLDAALEQQRASTDSGACASETLMLSILADRYEAVNDERPTTTTDAAAILDPAPLFVHAFIDDTGQITAELDRCDIADLDWGSDTFHSASPACRTDALTVAMAGGIARAETGERRDLAALIADGYLTDRPYTYDTDGTDLRPVPSSGCPLLEE